MKKLAWMPLILFTSTANAATYYVSQSTGRDSNTGLSHAQAWKTTAKVNATVTTAGDDVYFLAGDTWKETLTIDWGGNADNQAIVGSYYMSGTETIGVPTGTEKPTFLGNCNTKLDCPHDTTAAIPSDIWDPMIKVSGNYTTVQHLKTKNSAGVGIAIAGTAAAKQRYNHNYILDNTTDGSLSNGILLNRTSHTNVIRGNTVTRAALKRPYRIHTNWPAAVGLAKSDNNIIENNYIYNTFGEAVGVFDISHRNIIRNNLIIKGNKAGVYVSCSNDNIIENNKVLGDKADEFALIIDGYPSVSAYGATSETYCRANTTGNIFRNNLAANVRSCLGSSIEVGANKEGYIVTSEFYNNTCVKVGNGFSVNSGGASSGKANIIAKNNIITDATVQCLQVADTASTYAYNHFDANPAIEGHTCNGPNDVYGSPSLNITTGWDAIGADNIPNDQSFNVNANSTAISAGTALTTTALTYTKYSQYALLAGEAAGNSSCIFDLKSNANDHDCATRHLATPDIGAFQHGTVTSSLPSAPSNFIVE